MKKLLTLATGMLLCVCALRAQNRPIPTNLIVWDSAGDHYMSIISPTKMTVNDTLVFPQINGSGSLVVSNSPSVQNITGGISITGGLTVSGGLTTDSINITKLLEVNGNAGNSGQVLTSQGPNAAPIWSTISVTGSGSVSGRDTTLTGGVTYSIGSSDFMVVFTSNANNQIVDLPAASNNGGRTLIVESKNTQHAGTITPHGSDTINGTSGNYTLNTNGSSYIYIVSDGISNWLVLSSH